MIACRLGRFWGPWLAYTTLSGIGGGLLFGLCATLIGLVSGLFTLVGGVAASNFLKAATNVAQSFPDFAQIVLLVMVWGFVGGLITGTVSGLVGGNAGYSWSFAAFFGFICLSPHFFVRHHGMDPTILIWTFSALGALLPNMLLAKEAEKHNWSEPISRWMQGTWLGAPPRAARLGGVLLPIFIWIGIDTWRTAPIYAANQNYVTRLGVWTAWKNSRRFATTNNYARRSSCQSNLKQIMLAVKQYSQDYDEFLPPRPSRTEDGAGAILQPYLKSTYLFQCPAEFYSVEGSISSETAIFKSGDFSDYWINARTYGLNEAKFTSQVDTVMWGDGNTGTGEGTAAYSLTKIPARFGPATRHFNVANYAFVDGHVKALRPGAVSNSALPATGFPTIVP